MIRNVSVLAVFIAILFLIISSVAALTGVEVKSINCPSTIKIGEFDETGEFIDTRTLDFEEYIKGVVYKEMWKEWVDDTPLEALKAQAIASRGFAIIKKSYQPHDEYDLCNKDHCQVWESEPIGGYPSNVIKAVDDTTGIGVTYNNSIIESTFFSSTKYKSGHIYYTMNSEEARAIYPWNYCLYLRKTISPEDSVGAGGHGVGMSQYGSKILAEQEIGYEDILKHYYGPVPPYIKKVKITQNGQVKYDAEWQDDNNYPNPTRTLNVRVNSILGTDTDIIIEIYFSECVLIGSNASEVKVKIGSEEATYKTGSLKEGNNPPVKLSKKLTAAQLQRIGPGIHEIEIGATHETAQEWQLDSNPETFAYQSIESGNLNNFVGYESGEDRTYRVCISCPCIIDITKQGTWPTYQHDLQHTGRSEFAGPQITENRMFNIISGNHYPGSAQPIVGNNGVIYLAVGDNQDASIGKLYALNPDGTIRWQHDLGGMPTTPAIGVDGTIYVQTIIGKVYAISPNGSEKWIFQCENGSRGITVGPDGIIYVPAYPGLYALNTDGTQKWLYQEQYTWWGSGSSTTQQKYFREPAIALDGTIYIVFPGVVGMVDCVNGSLHALNPDGTLKWKSTLGGYNMGSPSVGQDGTIYVSGTYLYAYNQINGNLIWKSQIYGNEGAYYYTPSTSVISPDGNIITGVNHRRFFVSSPPEYFVAGFNSNGEKLWIFTPAEDNYGFQNLVLDRDSTIFVSWIINPNAGNELTRIYWLDSISGVVKKSFDISKGSPASVDPLTIGSNDNLYIPLVFPDYTQWPLTQYYLKLCVVGPNLSLLKEETATFLPTNYQQGLGVVNNVNLNIPQQVEYANSTPQTTLKTILNWGGSEMKLEVYKPDGTLYGQWQSSTPPIIIDVPTADTGGWKFIVTAIDIPYTDYPFALVVGTKSLDMSVPLSTGWNMISCPGDPVISDWTTLLNGKPVAQFAFSYNTSIKGFDIASTVEFGKGYLIKVNQDTQIDIQYQPPSTLGCSLSKGWNTLGSLYANIPVSNITTEPVGTTLIVFYMNPSIGGFDVTSNIVTGRGYLIYATNACDITLDCSASPSPSITQSKSTKPTWEGMVKIRTKSSYRELVFGMNSSASDGFDIPLDIPVPPFLPDMSDNIKVGWVIEGSDVNMLSHSFIKDNPHASWELSVELSEPGELQWTNLPKSYSSQLVYNGQAVGMDQVGSISLPAGKHSIKLMIDSSSSLPSKTQLLANYPNPFNPETWIPYRLSKDSEINLVIYDTQGKEVRRFHIGTQTAGEYVDKSHSIYWDGKNNQGEVVSSGVYFYALQTKDFTQTRKLVIIR